MTVHSVLLFAFQYSILHQELHDYSPPGVRSGVGKSRPVSGSLACPVDYIIKYA